MWLPTTKIHLGWTFIDYQYVLLSWRYHENTTTAAKTPRKPTPDSSCTSGPRSVSPVHQSDKCHVHKPTCRYRLVSCLPPRPLSVSCSSRSRLVLCSSSSPDRCRFHQLKLDRFHVHNLETDRCRVDDVGHNYKNETYKPTTATPIKFYSLTDYASSNNITP